MVKTTLGYAGQLAETLRLPGCPLTTLQLHADAVTPEELATLAEGVQHSRKLHSLELGQTALTGRAGLPVGPPSLARPHTHATTLKQAFKHNRKQKTLKKHVRKYRKPQNSIS